MIVLSNYRLRSMIARLLACVFVAACIVVGQLPSHAAEQSDRKLQFNRDIRPILAQNCFKCHGPDENEREADLRLDTQSGLFGDTSDGKAVIAGKPEASALLRRITSKDADARMPPPDSGKKLTADEIAAIRALGRCRRGVARPLGVHSASATSAAAS